MQWRPVPRADISIPNVGELSIQDGVKRRRLIYLGRHNNPATARGCGRGGESALSRDRGLLEPSEPSPLPIPILFPRSHNTTRGERDQVHFVRSTSWQFCSDQEGCSVSFTSGVPVPPVTESPVIVERRWDGNVNKHVSSTRGRR